MSKTLRLTLLSLRDLLATAGPFLLLAVALLGAAYWLLDPTPPSRVTLATGPAGSAYEAFGKRYAQELKQHGIEVVLVPTEGSTQNLQLLRDYQVDLGFVQGGSNEVAIDDDNELESLGSLFVEPLWLFYRSDAARRVTRRDTLSSLKQLQGLHINVGSPGSGTPQLMNQLLELNHIDRSRITLSREKRDVASAALLQGKLDAMVFTSAPEAPLVQQLLQTPGIRLLNFAQSEAYARRLPFLTPVTLPRGVVDLASNIPARDVKMLATTTTLLADEDVHPALMQLFSQASLKLHGKAGWFNRIHEFPNMAYNEFPIAKEAENTLRNGIPLLQRHLPYLLANLMERMWLAMGLILAILLPLSRVIPPIYQFRIRSRVFRWYGQLRTIEDQLQNPDANHTELMEELQSLDRRVTKVAIPLSYADELYALRSNIELVRRKLHPVTAGAA